MAARRERPRSTLQPIRMVMTGRHQEYLNKIRALQAEMLRLKEEHYAPAIADYSERKKTGERLGNGTFTGLALKHGVDANELRLMVIKKGIRSKPAGGWYWR